MSRMTGRDLIERYPSFWQPLLPFADVFLRQINLQLHETFLKPIDGETEASRRAFVNELSFELCARRFPDLVPATDVRPFVIETSKAVFERVSRYEGPKIGHALSAVEIKEAVVLARRLGFFLKAIISATPVLFHERLPGVELIGDVFPDIIADDTLVEVKNGERAFRSIDLRQTLLYATVASAQSARKIANLCLVNPRQGIFFRATAESLCRAVSGRSAVDLFSEVTFLLTQDGIY